MLLKEFQVHKAPRENRDHRENREPLVNRVLRENKEHLDHKDPLGKHIQEDNNGLPKAEIQSVSYKALSSN